MAGTRTTMNGKAVVITTAGVLAAYASITIQGIKGDHAFEVEEVKDFEGFDASWLARNEHINLKVSVKLTGASKAGAIANGAFLVPLSAVSLSGFDLSWINATWQYREGSSIDLINDKAGGMEVSLRKYVDGAQNTAATTAAS